MQAIGTHTMARRIADFGRARKTRLYYAAGICLLVVAAGLRFHDLSEKSLRHDEAATANYSRGALSEVISKTRCCSSSPILYPLILYAVQKVESTPFSIRVVPATASVLTVALMLFLLPRLGVARGAAFLAALLATLSVQAIWHAQDAREYSIDALLAVLMIAGLLWYLREGRKALLCASLFLAPLLQYGLVLFGFAVIGAAVVAPRVSGAGRAGLSPGRTGDWLKRRLDLVVPCGFFLAGGALSYLMTLPYQWQEEGFASDTYLSAYYYAGKFDAYSIFEFSIDRVWGLLTYHLPAVVAMAALPAFAILLVAALLGKFRGKPHDGAIAVLFSFCIAVSAGAAVLGIYPLGGIHQVIYLGPIVFLAIGLAFHWTAGRLSSLTRRGGGGGTRHVLLVAMAGATVLAGVSAMRQNSPYQTPWNIKSVLAVLKELVREEDMVYVGWGATPGMRFYQDNEEGPTNYHYGTYYHWCGTSSSNPCLREMADLAYWSGIVDGRIWFVTTWLPDMSGLSVEQVVSGGLHGVYLIEDTEALINRHATDVVRDLEAILTRTPSIRSTFDVYLSEDMLTYVKEPCGAEDVQETFFVHVVPADENDLPDHRKQYGFGGFNFRFNDGGNRRSWFRPAERRICIAWRELPDYPITRVRTGQFLVNEDGSTTHLWEGEIRVDE